MLILFSCCYGCPAIKDRTDSTIIAKVQKGELKGLGIAHVDGEYHVRAYDGVEIVFLGPEPERAVVLLRGKEEMTAEQYLELSHALK